MTYNALSLLTEILRENNISPKKLHRALEKYSLTVDEYLKIVNKDENEIIYNSLKEINRAVEGFDELLQFAVTVKKELLKK